MIDTVQIMALVTLIVCLIWHIGTIEEREKQEKLIIEELAKEIAKQIKENEE